MSKLARNLKAGSDNVLSVLFGGGSRRQREDDFLMPDNRRSGVIPDSTRIIEMIMDSDLVHLDQVIGSTRVQILVEDIAARQ